MIIYTWNMGHTNGSWTYLNQFLDADTICLQETSIRYTHLSNHRLYPKNGEVIILGDHKVATSTHHQSCNRQDAHDPGGMDVAIARFRGGMNSVGVMMRKCLNPGRTRVKFSVIPPPKLRTRTTITRATIGLQSSSGTWVFSIHAPSMRGSRQQMEWIYAVLKQISRQHIHWICAGDFNADPSNFDRNRLPRGSTIINTGLATHFGGSELDFAVCSGRLLTNAQRDNNFTSDHWAIKLT